MKVNLARNWSESFSYYNKDGYFIGRRKEIKSLSSIIRENSCSSILISSSKGVGKTSFVHKTIVNLEDESHNLKKKFLTTISPPKILPIFLDMSHVLNSGKKGEKLNKEFLKALIRTANFALNPDKEKISNEGEEINQLYKESLGDFVKGSANEETEKKIVSTKLDLKEYFLIAMYIISLGGMILIPDEAVRFVLAFFQILLGGIGITYESHKSTTTTDYAESKLKNDTEYLEIQFENWCNSQEKNGTKLIFIIDELDKVEKNNNDPLEIIKSFKNLFSRSLAHYIFIADYSLYKRTEAERDKGKDSYCPTLFTHRIFLSLPTSTEIRRYLHKIFEVENTSLSADEKKEIEELCNYLLYKAGNDFFELKRLLFDVVEYNDNQPYLDTEQIKKEDKDYHNEAQLYNYVDYIIGKSTKKLKKFWQDNSNLRRDVFKFFNQNFAKPFSEGHLTPNQKMIVTSFNKKGILKKAEVDEKGDQSYIWTGRIPTPNEDTLSEEEKNFLNKYNQIIQLANIIDELPENYNISAFYSKKFSEIQQEHDGEYATGIKLFSYYENYKDLAFNLNDISKRSQVSLEESQVAGEELKNILISINDSKLDIFKKITELTLGKNSEFGSLNNENPDENQPEINIHQQILTGLPKLLEVAQNKLLFRVSSENRSKTIFFTNEFQVSEEVKEDLETLSNNRNILFINLTLGLKYKENIINFSRPKKIGKGKKDIKVTNFKMVELKEIIDYGKVLKIASDFLSNK